MQTVCFEIVGYTPLLQHNPLGMRGQDGTVSRKRIPTAEEEALAGTYRLPDGTFYHPAVAFRNSLVDGAGTRRLGRVYVKSIINQTVFVTHEEAILVDPDTKEPLRKYEIDVRRAVVQGQGIVRARPMWPRWATMVELEYDSDLLEPRHILEVFEIAGRNVGVGEYRPLPNQNSKTKGKGGPFGRYTVRLVTGEE